MTSEVLKKAVIDGLITQKQCDKMPESLLIGIIKRGGNKGNKRKGKSKGKSKSIYRGKKPVNKKASKRRSRKTKSKKNIGLFGF